MSLRFRIGTYVSATRARMAVGWNDDRHRVILHIGPHRTGTTTIQATLRVNEKVGFANAGIGVVTRRHPEYLPLSRMLHDISTREAAVAKAQHIREKARDVAHNFATEAVTIISDEDFLGPLPTRRNIKGVYPFVELTLPHVLAGFRDAGLRVVIAWQPREFSDWLESIYHRRNDLAPTRPFDLTRFRRRHNLSVDWRDFERRLRRASVGVSVERLSFEEDAASGVMGRGLFRLAGLTDAEIKDLRHSRPRHSAPMRGTLGRFAGE